MTPARSARELFGSLATAIALTAASGSMGSLLRLPMAFFNDSTDGAVVATLGKAIRCGSLECYTGTSNALPNQVSQFLQDLIAGLDGAGIDLEAALSGDQACELQGHVDV